MAVLANNDIYQARFFVTLQTQTAIMVRHYKIRLADGNGTDDLLAASLAVSFPASIKAVLSNQATYRGVGVQRLSPIPKTVEVYNTSGAGVGDQASPPLPKQVAGVINFKTQYAGRSYRGRVYVPFPAIADSDTDTTPTAAYTTRLNLLAISFNAVRTIPVGVGPTEAVPVVYSRKFGTGEPVTLATFRDKWGTQRRRGDFGQSNPSPI